MFERFTVEALRAVELARDEARALGSNVVEPEHLLLGLLLEGSGAAGRVLASFDINLDIARDEVVQLGEQPDPTAPTGLLSRRTKRLLRASRLEMLRTGSSSVGTEHLLLALAGNADRTLLSVMLSLGIHPPNVVRRLTRALAPPPEYPSSRFDTDAAEPVARSEDLPPFDSTPARRTVTRRLRPAVTVLPWVATDVAATATAAATVGLVLMARLAGSWVLPTGWVAVAVAAWLPCLALAGTYDRDVRGLGRRELARLAGAAVLLTAWLGLAGLGTATLLAGVVTAVGLLLSLTLGGRLGLRGLLRASRARGWLLHRVVVVGHEAGVLDLLRQLGDPRWHGLDVVAACLPVPGQRPALWERGVPVIGGLGSVPDVVRLCAADTVVVLASSELRPEQLQRLAWALEPTRADLLVAASLGAVVGPRQPVRPAPGLLLLRVDQPHLHRVRRLVRTSLDRVVALLAIVLLAPVLVVIAVAVRTTSRGPALYRQLRVGKDGKPFTKLLFRTMVVDSDAVWHNRGQRDPRLTRVGGWLRRSHLVNLPELFNVLGGSMAFVGPRALPAEATQYDDVRRRLRVRPGITGPWRAGGGSELSWPEEARLDLRYVDGWALGADLGIVWRSVRGPRRRDAA